MTIETIEIAINIDKLNELSNDTQKSEFITETVEDNKQKLAPVFNWYIDDQELAVDFVDTSLIVNVEIDKQTVGNELSGTINLLFELYFYSGCSDSSNTFDQDEWLDFILEEGFLILTFEHPKEFKVLL